MIEDKDHDCMNPLERERTCRYWISDEWASGYCRVIGKHHTCHYSQQRNLQDCPVSIAFVEGARHQRQMMEGKE